MTSEVGGQSGECELGREASVSKTAKCDKCFLRSVDSNLVIGFSQYMLSVIMTKLFCKALWAKARLQKAERDGEESNLK